MVGEFYSISRRIIWQNYSATTFLLQKAFLLKLNFCIPKWLINCFYKVILGHVPIIRLWNSLIKHSTCIKNPKNLSFIGLILKKKASACVTEIGLSDFHWMTNSVQKCTFISCHQGLSITEISRNLSVRNLTTLNQL